MKRLIAVMLAILMTVTLMISASAASVDTVESGKSVVDYGDWYIEKINNGTQWELDEYKGTAESVSAPRFIDSMLVVSFGSHCFANNATLKSVTTSSPLWTIGEYAFIDCTALESIELNYALHTIEVGAFSGTSSLKSINLETSVVTKINPYTFLNSGIEEVALPTTCTEIGNYAFGQCRSLVKITIPESVTTIHENAFKDSDNVVIYCYTDSYAHTYAAAHGIPFVLIDAPATVTFLLGDADGDGDVTIVDATVIQRVLVELMDDTDGMIALRGSVDGDELEITHATKIQRYLVGIDVAEPIGTEVTRELPGDTQ